MSSNRIQRGWGWIGKRPDFRPIRRTLTPQELLDKAMSAQVRTLKNAGLIGNRVPPNWKWKLGDKSGVVAGFTKGEVRAAIKKELGLSKKKRLPQGIEIKLVETE